MKSAFRPSPVYGENRAFFGRTANYTAENQLGEAIKPLAVAESCHQESKIVEIIRAARKIAEGFRLPPLTILEKNKP